MAVSGALLPARRVKTFLQRCPVLVKFAALLALQAGLFSVNSLPSNSVKFIIPSTLAVFLTAVLIVLQTGVKGLLRGVRMIIILCFPALLLKSVLLFPLRFSFVGFIDGVLFCLSMECAFLVGCVFFACTKRYALLQLFTPRIGLALSLMLGFIPRFFEIWGEVNTAYKARGGKKSFLSFARLLRFSLERIIEDAVNKADAVKNRLLDG